MTPAAALAAAGLILCLGRAGHAEDATPLRDYLIQNVCLGAAGAVLDGVSPIDANGRCAAQRDLRPGENLPYHKHDHPAVADRAALPRGYQRHDSYPVATARLGVVVEQSFDFGVGDGRRFGVFDEGKGDGGDIDLVAAGAASIAATEDAGAGFQLFVGPQCSGAVGPAALEGAWIIARWASPPAGETIARLADLRAGHQAACPARLNAAFTRWYLRPVTYRAAPGQGRPVTLLSLISEHYGGADPATAGHVERFYFTRELGAARWERWQNTAKSKGLFGTGWFAASPGAAAAAFAAGGRCSAAPAPAGGAPLVMVDCREWTVIVPPDRADGDRAGFFIDAIRRRGLGGGLFAAAPDAKPQLGFK